MEYNYEKKILERNSDFIHPMDNIYKSPDQRESCDKCSNSKKNTNNILNTNKKTCKKCNETFSIFSWWGALGCYAFYCIVKESIDIIKYVITLF